MTEICISLIFLHLFLSFSRKNALPFFQTGKDYWKIITQFQQALFKVDFDLNHNMWHSFCSTTRFGLRIYPWRRIMSFPNMTKRARTCRLQVHIQCVVKCCRNKHIGSIRQDWETAFWVHNLFPGNTDKELIVEIIYWIISANGHSKEKHSLKEKWYHKEQLLQNKTTKNPIYHYTSFPIGKWEHTISNEQILHFKLCLSISCMIVNNQKLFYNILGHERNLEM